MIAEYKGGECVLKLSVDEARALREALPRFSKAYDLLGILIEDARRKESHLSEGEAEALLEKEAPP